MTPEQTLSTAQTISLQQLHQLAKSQPKVIIPFSELVRENLRYFLHDWRLTEAIVFQKGDCSLTKCCGILLMFPFVIGLEALIKAGNRPYTFSGSPRFARDDEV